MKKLYWRPARAPGAVLILVALTALAGVFAVEKMQRRTRQPFYKEKLAAARLALKGMQVVREGRLQRRVPIDPEVDPSGSGLIGLPMSSVTTNSGVLEAKQTTINPNFAAVLVHLLKKAGAEKGDHVAVGVSGSFPAVNIATFAAISQLGLKAVSVASASGSQFGANIPGYLWVDMEGALVKQGVFPFRSVAASMGGIEDRAFGMSAEGKVKVESSIRSQGIRFINSRDLKDGIAQRMAIYREAAGTAEYVAYINVGGGAASVGTALGKKLLNPGLNRTLPREAGTVDSVTLRFLRDGVPVIHIVNIKRLAERYGLPDSPATIPPPGEGKIFSREEYSNWLAASVLVLLVGGLYMFVRTDLGLRLLRRGQSQKAASRHPEQMV